MMNKRFESLDAFRGLCALSVVLFHLHLSGSITELAFFRGSWVLVDFFFVLSGFVLAHGYGYKENINFSTFMKARFFRIYPLHFFMFLVFILLEIGKLLVYKFGGLVSNHIPFTGNFSINGIIPDLLLVQSWTPFTNPLSFNAPSWSISIEFYLYVLFFISIVIFKSYRVISWVLLSLIAFIIMYSGSELLVSNVLRGLSCFFGGAFTYAIYKNLSRYEISYMLGSIIESTLIVSVILVVQSGVSHQSIVTSGLFFLTVFLFAFESGLISKVLKINLFQCTGKLSYSIYMTHFAILSSIFSIAGLLQKITGIEIAPTIEGIRYLTFGNNVVNNFVILLIFGIIVYISNLTYRYIETYGQSLTKQLQAKSRWFSVRD